MSYLPFNRLFYFAFFAVWTPVTAYSAASENAQDALRQINDYFNNHFTYRTEPNDRWLLKERFIAEGGGDCEDFALGKYQALLERGLQSSEFRFVYALQIQTGSYHILLRHAPTGLLLDSLTSSMNPIEQRPDLSEQFQFTSRQYYPGEKSRLTRNELRSLQAWQQSIRLAEKTAQPLTHE